MLRALIDANLFVSYLLARRGGGEVEFVVEAGILGRYTILLPEELLEELSVVIRRKAYLASRISPEVWHRFADILRGCSELLPPIPEPIPRVVRDPKDDYLLAHAVVARADALVTGDRDLLALSGVAPCRILSPARFAEVLRSP
ncbi:putative toxin-antitoxin system toxin component, PIN family [Deferrisoma palaeochoriense]